MCLTCCVGVRHCNSLYSEDILHMDQVVPASSGIGRSCVDTGIEIVSMGKGDNP